MEFSFRVDFGLVSGIFLGLVVLGIGYNALTALFERKGYMEGFTSLMVAGGVVMTLLPLLLISPVFVLIVAGAFLASGTPMIIGSVSRYVRNRERAKREIARLHGDPIEDLAD